MTVHNMLGNTDNEPQSTNIRDFTTKQIHPGISNKMEAKNPCKPYPIVSQNKKDTRQQAADSMGNTARRSNAVDFLFWLTI
ncbi:hypothetical protein CGZ77_05105 [Neisseria sp. KEM232]|nr:hypothetical protein CGZ77_05105 [Neisseria sp. KEM232]